MRMLFRVPEDYHRGLLIFNFFLSIEQIVAAVRLFPFFISSIVIVFGVAGFVVEIIGPYGLLTLGLAIFLYIIEFALLCYMLGLHH